ncbi:MAG: MMPL family transporter [Flavobacteriales bacterium]|nr:MMPL family transporter [Flavobacteriales bacterium]
MRSLQLRPEDWLTKRNARFALLLVGLLTVCSLAVLRNVRFDFDFERFFPTDDPELDRYLAHRERFGSDMDMLLIGLQHGPSVFDSGFLERVDSLTGLLMDHPDIEVVTSPTRAYEPRLTPVGLFQVPWLRLGADSLLPLDSARIWRDGEVRENFFSDKGDVMLILIRTAPELSKARSDSVLLGVERSLARCGFENARLGGRIHGQYHYIRMMQTELFLFFGISVLLLALFLAITFRTWWGVLVPIVVVGLTVLWQVALMTLLGKPLSVLTMLLPTILFVVGMSDVVHLLERYIEALRNGRKKPDALGVAMREVGMATFLTSLTTAIGFLTLISSSILPIREFGLYTAIGVGLAFVLAYLLLPAVLLLVPTPVPFTEPTADRWWPVLHGIHRFTIRRRRTILWVGAAIVLLNVLLIPSVKVNNYLLEDIPEDAQLKEDFLFLEEHFGGIRPFEMELVITNDSVTFWDRDVLVEVDRIVQRARTDYGVHGVLSLPSLVSRASQVLNGGDTTFRRVPYDQLETDRAGRILRSFAGADLVKSVVSEDGKRSRISGRVRDEGGYIHLQKDEQLMAFVRDSVDTRDFAVHMTGMAYLIDQNNKTLSRQLIMGLSVAFLLISVIMVLVFRNYKVALVALIPNVVPLVVIGGLMGATGIDLKVSTSIIFTIAFGIAVDDTIHLLGKLRIEQRKGRDLFMAMKRSALSAGRAVIITSLMLVSGFVALIASDFASAFYLGALVSATLLVAVVTDLLLLPVLVWYLLPRKR